MLDRHTSLKLEEVLSSLLAYCRAENWAGYDPYDALNSRLLTVVPGLNSRWPRVALTQILKRSPINLRPLLRIPKKQNPKALALFLASLLRLPDSLVENRGELIWHMIDRLRDLRSQDAEFHCWGYSFPWQGRSILVPAGAPNLVCTAFVAEALLDAHEHGHSGSLETAISAAEYILKRLYWDEGERCGFSYPIPGLRGETHNANLLAAALLCRIYRVTNETKFVEPALKVARQAVRKQRPDGAWCYGEGSSQQWVDNFHTGYNLKALNSIARSLDTSEFDEPIRRGFTFYRQHFFCADGAPKYFHDRVYPIDIHCVAESILTLIQFQELDPDNRQLAEQVFAWATEHMWDKRGFFYYRVLRTCTIRTSYMRWSQAWMLLAMSALLYGSKVDAPRQQDQAVGAARI